MTSQLRIIVLGYVVRRPLGGGTWPTMQYALGLQRLGHDVWFLEDSDDYGTCYDPSRHVTDEDPTFGLAYASRVFERMGMGDRWAFHDALGKRWHGPAGTRMESLCETADLVINVSGINPMRPWLRQIPRRAWVDTDPAFEQVRHVQDPRRRALAREHNVFFTYGENIPRGLARHLPDVDLPWLPTRQPVVLEHWPITEPAANAPLTTVMLWSSYASRAFDGQKFGMKDASFEPYLALPRHIGANARLEMAVGGPDVPRRSLRENGWHVTNPLGPTKDPWIYQQYLRDSLGEFTVAKHGYAVSNCGWFSERSAHYLASGRAVITMHTGFAEWLPTGEGLLAFDDLDTAIAAIESVVADPVRHGLAARDLAAAFFDSDKVLADFVERAMNAETSGSTPAGPPSP